MVGKFRDESGNAIIQAAIVVPLLIVLLGVGIQLAILGYSTLALAERVSALPSTLEFSSMSSMTQAARNEQVKLALIDNVVGIAPDNLTISDTLVAFVDGDDAAHKKTGTSETGGTITSTKDDASLTCKLTYEVPSIISAFGFGELVLEKQVGSSQSGTLRVEVEGL